MTLAPDYSQWKRFWYWFFTGHTLGDPRFRNCQAPPRNLQRDQHGRTFFFPGGSTVPMYVYDMKPAMERAQRSLDYMRRQGLVPAWDADPLRPIELVVTVGLTAVVLIVLVHDCIVR